MREKTKKRQKDVSGAIIALMGFIRAGENNEIQIQVAPNNYNKTPEDAGVMAGIIQENKNKVQLVFIEAIHKEVNGLNRKQMKGNKESVKKERNHCVKCQERNH